MLLEQRSPTVAAAPLAALERIARERRSVHACLDRPVPRSVARAYDAPTMVVIACMPALHTPKVRHEEEEFATAAATHGLMLALTGLGLASLLTTGDIAESQEVADLVGLEHGRIVGVLNVGYRDPASALMARPEPAAAGAITWY